MTKTVSLTLTEEQFHQVMAAIAIATPHGGGSALFCTYRDITEQAERQNASFESRDASFDRQSRYADVVLGDAVEHGIVERI